MSREAKKEAEPLFAQLVAQLPPDVVAGAQERGRTKTLDEIVREI